MENNTQIPAQILEFSKSPEIFTICEKIGVLFGLHIDQVSEIDSEIRNILNGNKKSSEFTKDIASALAIDTKMAQNITEEVNKQVFSVMKQKLNGEVSNIPMKDSDIETAGGFEIEKTSNGEETNGVTADDRADILSGLENPVASKERIEKREGADLKEPLVDALLEQGTMAPKKPTTESDHLAKTTPPPSNLPTGGAGNVFEVKKEIPKAPTPPVPQKKTGPDPYREPVE